MPKKWQKDREPRHLFTLTDALEEAGCADADLLEHCRRPLRHTAGCYLLDAVLGVRHVGGRRAWRPPSPEEPEIPF